MITPDKESNILKMNREKDKKKEAKKKKKDK